jgi:hypothetical protein
VGVQAAEQSGDDHGVVVVTRRCGAVHWAALARGAVRLGVDASAV